MNKSTGDNTSDSKSDNKSESKSKSDNRSKSDGPGVNHRKSVSPVFSRQVVSVVLSYFIVILQFTQSCGSPAASLANTTTITTNTTNDDYESLML